MAATVVGLEDQTVTMQDLFLFQHYGEDEDGRIIGDLEPTGLRPALSPGSDAPTRR